MQTIHLKHPLVIGTGVTFVVAFFAFISSARKRPLYQHSRLIEQNITTVNYIANHPHKHPIVDLTQTVAGLAYLNSLDTLVESIRVLQQTGVDVRELRQVLEERARRRSIQLDLSPDALRNATH